MKQDKKNEELQSRRSFFKNAAKGVLPILGAIALSQVPIISQAATSQSGCHASGCANFCVSSCSGCKNGCLYGCQTNCKGSCSGTCSYGCGHSSR